MEQQGVAATCLFPTLGVGIEEALKSDPEAAVSVFRAFNRWLEEDWGFRYGAHLRECPTSRCWSPTARPPSSSPVARPRRVVVNIRNSPAPVPGGHRSPFDPAYDRLWSWRRSPA